MQKLNKNKIKEILGKLNSLEQGKLPVTESKSLADEIINKQYYDTTSKIKEDSTIQFLDAIDKKLNKFQTDFDLQPLSSAIESFQEELETIKGDVSSQFRSSKSESESKIGDVNSLIKKLESAIGLTAKNSNKVTSPLIEGLESLRNEFGSSLKENKKLEEDLNTKFSEIDESLAELNDNLNLLSEESDSQIHESIESNTATIRKEIKDIIESLRKDLIQKMANLGGGSMNRQILIGGVDPLTRYTDINFKAGSNVTITYANNNTTKKVDVTISATGGGGGGGITRSIQSISSSQAAGSASATDYVYLCSGTMTLTMPDATAGNTNLYTVKNVGTGVVTVNTTSAQTIDGGATAVLQVRYTAIDLESDSVGWNVT